MQNLVITYSNPFKLLISALLLIFDFLAKIDYNQTNIGKVSMWGNFSGEGWGW